MDVSAVACDDGRLKDLVLFELFQTFTILISKSIEIEFHSFSLKKLKTTFLKKNFDSKIFKSNRTSTAVVLFSA